MRTYRRPRPLLERADVDRVEAVLDQLHEIVVQLPDKTRNSTKAEWVKRLMLFQSICDTMVGRPKSHARNTLSQLNRHIRDAQAEVDFANKQEASA